MSNLDTIAKSFAATIGAEWPHEVATRAGANLRPQYVHEEGVTGPTNVYGSEAQHTTPDGDVRRLSHGGAFILGCRSDFLEWLDRADEDQLENLAYDNPAHDASDFGGTARVETDDRVETLTSYEALQALLDLEVWDNDEECDGNIVARAEWILRDVSLALWEAYEGALREALLDAINSDDEAAL